MSGQVSIMDIFRTLLKRWWIIVIMVAVCAGGVYVYSEYFLSEIFMSRGIMYISNSQQNDPKQGTTITTTNLTASEKLVATTIEILSSDSFVDEVALRSGLNISGKTVRDITHFSAKNDTQLLNLSVSSEVPQNAQTIANTILTYAPEYFTNIIQAGSIKVVDMATLSTEPSSPNVSKNVLFGIVVGFLIGAITAFVIELVDIRVKPEDDLGSMYNMPVLGTIPELTIK